MQPGALKKCIYTCKECSTHHIEVKEYKSAPHASPLQS